MGQSVTFGFNVATGTDQMVNTDGAGRLQVASYQVSPAGLAATYLADNGDGQAVSSGANKSVFLSRGYIFNGTSWDRQRGDTNGAWGVATGSAAALVGIVPVTSLNGTALVLKASPGNFYGASIVAGTTAGFLVAYNAIAAPAPNAALTPALILGVVPVAASGVAALGDYTIPDRFSVGIVLLFTTSLANYTVPATPALFLRGKDM